MPNERIKYYPSCVSKLLHMMRYGRVESNHSFREASKFMNKNTGEAHIKHKHRVMKCVAGAPESGLFVKSKEIWDGELDYDSLLKVGQITDMKLNCTQGNDVVVILRNWTEC